MSLTLRWILNYVIALVLVAGLQILLFSMLEGLDEPMFALMGIFFIEVVMIILAALFQLAAIIGNLLSEKTRLRFFTAIGCIYAIIGIVMYTLATRFIQSMLEVNSLLYNTDKMHNTPPPDTNVSAYFGTHTFLLIPLAFQIVIFIILYRKQRKNRLPAHHEPSGEHQTTTA